MRKQLRCVAFPAFLLFLVSCSQPAKYEFHATSRGDTSVVYRCDRMTGEAWVGTPSKWTKVGEPEPPPK